MDKSTPTPADYIARMLRAGFPTERHAKKIAEAAVDTLRLTGHEVVRRNTLSAHKACVKALRGHQKYLSGHAIGPVERKLLIKTNAALEALKYGS